jgi:hypothetical protein
MGKLAVDSQRGGCPLYTSCGEKDRRVVYKRGPVFFGRLGKNWISSSYQPRQDSYIYELVKAGNYLIMSNNYGIHRSSDHGQSWKLIYTTESMVFFDFLVVGQDIYGGTRTWDEYRGRK